MTDLLIELHFTFTISLEAEGGVTFPHSQSKGIRQEFPLRESVPECGEPQLANDGGKLALQQRKR
jgi:hypothetical protein